MGQGRETYLCDIAEADLPFILEWRNHPKVRSVMFTDQVITAAEHLAWWERIQADPRRRVLLCFYQDTPVGIVNYYDIDSSSRTCHWGFYLDNDSAFVAENRLAIWLALEKEAIRYAFEEIGSSELLCEMFEFNKEVILIHRKFGFQEVSRLTREKQGKPEIVVVMSLINASQNIKDQTDTSSHASDIRIAFLGSANWDLIAQDFATRYHAITDEQADIFAVPFGQYQSMLLDENSGLRKSSLDYYVFCERLEDFLTDPFALLDSNGANFYQEKFDQYLGLIKSVRASVRGTFLVLDLAPSRPLVATYSDAYYADSSIRGMIARLNSRLESLCASLPDCHLIRLSALLEGYGGSRATASKYWHLGRMAYSAGFGTCINDHLTGAILALRGKTARVLVLDLDNTLWGGVVGDDGVKGIQVGGDYPGSLYSEMQHCIKSFKERGVALAICSKNTEAIALEAIDSHQGMVLRSDDFIVRRINWKDKADNIREIAAEIGVGLSSLCFIDDSPYERDVVRRQLPEVIVPDMPADVSQWSAFLCSHPFLATMYLTQEDKERLERYKTRAKILSESESFTSKEDYWRSLEMTLHFHELHDGNLQRVIQLLAKTNQFNMTTKRYGEQDIRGIIERGGRVIPIGLSDKYSPHEVIGVVVLVPDTPTRMVIDSFLLSCRVLGRSVETGILGWICRFASENKFDTLAGLFTQTDRNAPASTVYQEHGFVPGGNGYEFELSLARSGLTIPTWFNLHDEVN
jgi:UDP-4-amino-4,6-dideoxy-N-acetyl-beta-L-altrosamine N-acetyltransferase